MTKQNPFMAQNPAAKKANMRYFPRAVKDLFEIMPVEISVLSLCELPTA